METHKIDANGKKLGRVASEAAKILTGKNSVEYARNIVPNVKVEILNASQANIDDKKKQDKQYKSFSGYPDGLNLTTMERTIQKKGYAEIFRKAVYGMLPINKLRSRIIKNLTVKE